VRSLRVALALAGTAALCASAAAIAPAMSQPPQTAKLSIVGGIQMKAGKFIRDDQRFAPANREVRSGGSVRLRNRAKTEDPHTLSLVKRSDMPRTAEQAFACEACGSFFEAHQVNEETGDVGVTLVNVGEEGFDQPGDSIFVPPGGGTVRFDVSADRGKTLYYLCAVHPWMQGRLRVR
jgi:hypothetical protein